MTTRKKVSGTKTRRRKSSTAKKPLGATVKAFGKTWTKKSCHKNKASATKAATSARKAGRAAMVKKNPTGGSCLFTRAKSRSKK